MISPSTLEMRIKTLVDSEDSSRYSWDYNIREGVNYAINNLVMVLDKLMAERRNIEEYLDELTTYGTFTNSSIYGIEITPIKDIYWSILAVFPNGGITNRSAFHSTIEEWGNIDRNRFVQGTALTCINETGDYAYLSPISLDGKLWIHVKPALEDGTSSTVMYLSKPALMDKSESILEDAILLPTMFENYIVQKATAFITIKEAGEQLSYALSGREVAEINSLLT